MSVTTRHTHDRDSLQAKHERLLDEEMAIVERGMAVTRRLLEWYDERVESLHKRRRMLNKGMVALVSVRAEVETVRLLTCIETYDCVAVARLKTTTRERVGGRASE